MPFPDGSREAKNENLEKAIEILERLVAGHTDMPDYRHLLARCYREMSQQWFTHGSISAPDAAKKATDILQNLVEKYPDVPDYRYDLSKTYLALETSKMFSWKPADKDTRQESLEVIEKKVLPIAEQLVAENPNVPDYAVSLMQIRLQLGYMLWESNPSAAENYLKKALETQSMLVRHFPGVSPYQFGMAFIYDSLAGFYQNQKRLPDAQSMLKESIAVLKEALKKMPDAHPIRGILARNYMTLADLLRQTGDTEAAEEAVRQAESLRPGPKKPN
jgi:eukaryotic-like serine/threonine-protein kinase